MKTREMIYIDSDLLRRVLNQRNINYSELSRDIGFASSYISHAIKNGYVSKNAYKLLCIVLEVDEDYFILQEKKDSKQDDENLKQDELVEIIELLKEQNKILTEMVRMWKYD